MKMLYVAAVAVLCLPACAYGLAPGDGNYQRASDESAPVDDAAEQEPASEVAAAPADEPMAEEAAPAEATEPQLPSLAGAEAAGGGGEEIPVVPDDGSGL